MLFVKISEAEWGKLMTMEINLPLNVVAAPFQIQSLGNLLSLEQLGELERQNFGIKIFHYETNSNTYEILDKGKFLFACLKAGITPKIFTE